MSRINKLVAATRNPKKLHEVRRLLDGLGVKVAGLDTFETIVEAEETGATFEENASIKALSYAAQTGMPSVADDSGLEVDALAGAPGVFSSRYAGPGADDRALCTKLLAEMKDFPGHMRGARFRCCIAFACGPEVILTTQGSAKGRIIREIRGENGFGYDPVFVPEGHQKTFAEMEPAQKDKISHRAKAFAAFRSRFAELLKKPDA